MKVFIRKILSRDVSWAYLAQGSVTLLSLLFIPFLLRTLSTPELGLWFLLMGIVGFTSFFDLGFATSLSRSFTYAHSGVQELKRDAHGGELLGKENHLLLNELYSFSFALYRLLTLSFFIIALPLAGYYLYRLHLSLEAGTIFFSALIFFVALALNFLWQPYNFIVLGLKQVREYNIACIVGRLSYVLFGFVGILLRPSLITLVTAYFVSVLSERLMMRFYSHKFFRFSPTKLSWNRSKELFTILFYNSSRQWLCGIGAFLTFRVSILIAGLYLSIADISSFGLVLQIAGLITAFSLALLTTKTPKISAAVCLKNYQEALRMFSYSWVLGLFLYGAAGICAALFGRYFLELIGSNVAWLDNRFFLLFWLASMLEFNTSLFASFMSADNHVPYMKAYLLTGLSSVGLMYLSLSYFQFGLWSCVLSIFIAQMLYQNWYWPYYFSKKYKVSLWTLLKDGVQECWRAAKSLSTTQE